MKKFLIAAAGLIALATPALAADMAPAPYTKAPLVVPPPVFSWTGFYVGGNAGGGWARTEWFSNYDSLCSLDFVTATCGVSQKSDSFVGGGQIGGRWQTGSLVLGVEGSADYARFNAKDAFDPGDPFPLYRSTTLNNLYTVTGQIGFAVDRALFYGKGGWAGSSLTRDIINTALEGTNTARVSNFANGWTVGTGAEYSLPSMPNLSIGLEYDYVKLSAGNQTGCYTGPIGNGFDCPAPTNPLVYNGFKGQINEVLFRMNYTFGPSAPVVARY
jgi:outer membrane immunogenic protein